MALPSKFFVYVGVIIAVIVVGSIATYIVGHYYNAFNVPVDNAYTAVYFTITIVSTVGLGDIYPVTELGKIYVVVLIAGGLSIFITAITIMSSDFVNERIADVSGRITAVGSRLIKGSVVLLGTDSINMALAKKFRDTKKKFIMITSDKILVDQCRSMGYKAYLADYTLDSEMVAFGLDKAKSIVINLRNKSKTVYVLLIARKLSRGVKTLVIADSLELELHLNSLGLRRNERVINPSTTIANEIIEKL